jgi:lysophospholipase L1-like esterase
VPVMDMTAPPLESEELADRLRRAPWRRYVAIGDSLTEGLGDPVQGYPNVSWAEGPAQALKRLHRDFEFLNLGKRYLTARQVRETQLQPALDFEPDLATVLAGATTWAIRSTPRGSSASWTRWSPP